jgi:hypothetical protein
VNNVDDWAAKCQAQASGRIFLDNLGIDLALGHLKDADLKRFAHGLDVAVTSGVTIGQPDPYEAAVEYAVVSEKLLLQGRRVNRSRGQLAHVFRFDHILAGYWFNLSQFGFSGLDGPEEIFQTISETAAKLGGLGPLLRPKAVMKGRLEMVWLGFDDEITEVLAQAAADGRPGATAVRDALGLLHYHGSDYLCRMLLTDRGADGVKKRRPTAFDGGASLVYRSHEDTDPVGRAVHLQSHVGSLPELVAPPVPILNGDKMMEIGRVSRSTSFDWSKLANTTDPGRVDSTAMRIRSFAP